MRTCDAHVCLREKDGEGGDADRLGKGESRTELMSFAD